VTANGLGGRPMWTEGKIGQAPRTLVWFTLRRGVGTKGETWLLGWELRRRRRGVTVAATTAGKVWCVVESLLSQLIAGVAGVEKDQQ
jgi:hypothetical protein